QDEFMMRETFRVSPKEPTSVWLTMKRINFRLKCQLVDISAEGMAVFLPADYFAPQHIKKDAEVLLEFQLPSGGDASQVDIQARGIIKNTIGPAGYQQKRIGIRVYYDRRGGTLISQYTQQRMVDLRKEMDRTYDALFRLFRG
ncbi:MAG: PilZ domain-containing protein, partial [Anaerolineaceae bacterium]|nr:PilZ domain-containing protein [Anaerolineaceae bacterium]